ncbi:MAG: sulfatase-like hydrolase/transferase [Bacteroidota bacterium]|nr:sulfatase-like hydrolase/transferase [Bacteroidota bacterium]MDE2834358.1 sulfatase-like hydrolase/transferase [Bacteroidota bacterium]MDE2955457.1 sulfatase-like hydrolase/transferase [Bacteroidota bacterium]
MRVRMWKYLPLLLVCGCGSQESPVPAGPWPDRPNIVWISAEDMGPRLGAYGDSVARTPHLDDLAGQSTRYTRVFTTAGVCSPSRAAIITGMHQVSLGAHHMRTLSGAPFAPEPAPYSVVPPHYVRTFTEYLRAAGYYTTNNVKEDYQFETPITAWDESSDSAHWRGRSDPDQPFFSVFNFTTTHESRLWPDPAAAFASMGLPAAFAPPAPDALITDPDRVTVPPYFPDTPVVRRDIARQYDNIATMDAQAGAILAQLAEDGLADRTIIFFWSDHGDGLPRHKRWLYDSGLHVPLLIRVPGQAAAVNDDLISFLDLAPTVLSLAGVEPPVHLQGRALMGAFADMMPPEYVYGARDRFDEQYDMVRSVRDTRFKYIRNYRPEKPYVLWMAYANVMPTMQEIFRLHAAGDLNEVQSLWMADRRPVHELYDTASDPYEVDNLAYEPEYSTVLTRMQTALDEWMHTSGDRGFESELDMAQSMWPGGEQLVTVAPVMLPRAASRTAILPGDMDYSASGGTYDRPVEVILYSPTQGASINYRVADSAGRPGPWKLYAGPIRIFDTTRLQARAVRYGYQPSSTADATFEITGQP